VVMVMMMMMMMMMTKIEEVFNHDG